MRRALLLALVVGGMFLGALLLAFSVSSYNIREQRFGESLADFVFMVSAYTALAFDSRPQIMDEERISYALARYRVLAHWEVKKVAGHYIARWQRGAIPVLARELERTDERFVRYPWRSYGIVSALEEIGGEEALPLLLDIIGRHRLFTDGLDEDHLAFKHHVVKALGKTGSPLAARTLIEVHGKVRRLKAVWTQALFPAIAETGHGAEFLLNEARAASSAEELDRLIWPLAQTRHPQAMEFLVGLFARPELPIRRSVRDALDQRAGPAAIPFVVNALRQTRDEWLQSWLIQTILDDGDARDATEVVSALEPLLVHPALAWEARYALIRIGTSEAYAAMVRQFDRLKPDELVRNLEYANANALPLVERFLASSDSRVRRMMFHKIPEMYIPELAALIRPHLDDPEASVRHAAREAVLHMDRVLFWKSLTERLPESVGPSLFYAFKPSIIGAPLDHMLTLLRIVHGVGVVVSALLASALLFGLVKIVEPYRFDLFTAFLLLEGFIGDFLLLEFGSDPWLLIQAATGCHIALLAGVLLQPRELVPGELAGRFERLMGASVWLMMPLLLVFTTPVLAEALRHAFHGPAWSLALFGLFALVTVLVVEQWALRWARLPRSAIIEERLAALVWTAVSVLLLIAMLAWVQALWQSGRRDESIFAAVVAVPLLWLGLARLPAFKPTETRFVPPQLLSVPGGRFLAADLGAQVVLLVRSSSWHWTVVRTGLVLATGVAAAVMAGWEGKALSMLAALIMAPVGAATASLAIALVVPAWFIQLRGGYFRAGASRGGIDFWNTGWRRRLVLPLALERVLRDPQSGEAKRVLTLAEHGWIADLSQRQARAAGGT